MEKITKEQFEMAKSNLFKRTTIEAVLNKSKLLLDASATRGDDVFKAAIDSFESMLDNITDVVFVNIDTNFDKTLDDIKKVNIDISECPLDGPCEIVNKKDCDDEKPKKD